MALVDVTGALPGTLENLTRVRTAKGTKNAAGKQVDGDITLLSFQGCVQPANGADLKKLKEGVATSEVLRIYAATSSSDLLQLVTDTHLPDRVQRGSNVYEIIHVDDWALMGGYCKALVTKKGL